MAKHDPSKITGEILEKAKKELNEDPETRLIEAKNLSKRLQKVPGNTNLKISMLCQYWSMSN